MNLAFALNVESYPLLAVALAAGLAAALVAWRRRLRLPSASMVAIAAGMLALALAAGGLQWDRPRAGEVAVMVDLSASTRGARYRDPAALDRRIAQLLGSTPYRLIFFAERSTMERPGHDAQALPDLPGDRTVFAPPPAVAVLLFSDGRFELPASAAPTFVPLDPLLEQTTDSAIERLEARDGAVAVRVRNQAAEARELTVAGQRQQVGHGTVIVTRQAKPRETVAARVRGQDLWPENDALSLRISPPLASERWWVGDGAPAGWGGLAPADLPVEPEAYLSASIIALNNIPADALSAAQQQYLERYARDLGGGLLILGGERAFAAGGYPGSRLEAISPLSSNPPMPAMHWIILADSSGSMAEPAGETTRWEMVRRAAISLLGQLPPEDPASLGSFAQAVRWWSAGRSARETAALPLPPPDVRPHGPTNLELALQSIIAGADGGMPRQLLILSDADADIEDVPGLAQGLLGRQIRLHLLDTYGKGRGLPALRQLAARSGGQVVQEIDPGKWVEAARRLAGQAADDQLKREPAAVTFTGELPPLPSRPVAPWNRVWLKDRATGLAQTTHQDQRISLAGRWQQGLGRVAAVGFAPTAQEIEALAQLVEQQPADPRLVIGWDAGPKLRVSVDAVDGQAYLNDLRLDLELAEEGSAPRRIAIPQTGPGQYELAVDPPRRPAIASAWHGERILGRRAVAGRYPAEFDAIGNDRDTLQRLANLSGGRLIEPGSRAAISFDWPRQRILLAPWLCLTGFVLIGAGLLWWRLR
jgi:hypothetical protein